MFTKSVHINYFIIIIITMIIIIINIITIIIITIIIIIIITIIFPTSRLSLFTFVLQSGLPLSGIKMYCLTSRLADLITLIWNDQGKQN